MFLLKSLISGVSLNGSCGRVVWRSLTNETVILPSLLNRQTRNKSIRSSINTNITILKKTIHTMRPQVYLTRSDFPSSGVDLLRNE